MKSVAELRRIVELSDRQLEQFEKYLSCLLRWNRRFALVSQSDPRTILDKHFADSLHVVPVCRDARTLIDVGSGAGFPGLPIGVALPDLSVTLLDSSRKKVSFLTEAIVATGVTNVRALEARLGDLDVDRKYDIVTCRALAGIARFLPQARPILSPGGKVVMMKGPRFESDLETADCKTLGFTMHAPIYYDLPDGARRVLLVFTAREQSHA